MAKNNAASTITEQIRGETRKNIIINLILNAAIAYATLHSLTEISAWGEKGYGIDLIVTGFILCTILGAIFIAIFRRKCKKQQITPAGDEGQSLAWLLPYNPWLAAPWMGVLGAVIAAPLLLGLFTLLNVETLTPVSYAIIKGIWAAGLAGVVVPISIKQGLRSQPETVEI